MWVQLKYVFSGHNKPDVSYSIKKLDGDIVGISLAFNKIPTRIAKFDKKEITYLINQLTKMIEDETG
jgi:hypothetical protein